MSYFINAVLGLTSQPQLITMPAKIDPAIVRALSLDSSSNMSTHGGSGFASTYQITTPSTKIFVKTSSSPGAAVMFEGEHNSLNAINSVVPSLCPRSFAWGPLENGGFFLATEFLSLGRGLSRSKSGKSGGSGLSLAQKLAELHSTPAPRPEECGAVFGFPVTTCCGETPQPNSYKSSWAEFFGTNRLMAILDCAEKNNGKDASLRQLVEMVVEEVVPRLLADGHLGGSKGIQPVITHGDLWSGNKGSGSFVGRDHDSADETGPIEAVVFDPSAAYTHNEYEHGIQSMFGGFDASFWKDYFDICPKTEPVDEYEDRRALYESYHHLNHYAMFGGSYKNGAVSLLKPLVKKYGTK